MKNNINPYILAMTQKIYFGSVCVILFLPIVVLPPTFKPDSWGRVILFKLILTFFLGLLFYRFFYKKDLSFNVFTKKNPVFILFLVLTLFFLIIIISTVFSVDPRFSLFSSPNRSGGTINLTFYLLFALLLSVFIKGNYWIKLLKINLASGLVTSLFALIQYFGIFNKIFVSFSQGAGPPSFIGNSTFLAIYMIFLTFLSFYFFTQEHNRNKKIAYILLTALFLFTIIISGSRASYLGILVGLIFYFLFYPKKLKILKIATACVVTLAVIAILFFNLFPNFGSQYKVVEKVSSRLSISQTLNDLTGNRLPAWQMTWQAIKDRPLFGWGPENFYVGFEKYYSPVNDSLRKEWWDRPHNILLDVFASYGIFALIAYVTFWILLLIKLQIFKKREPDENKIYVAHAIQAMFLGYLTALLVNFDEFPTYLISFFFIGFSFYLISSHGEKIEVGAKQNSFLGKKFVAFCLLILVILFAWFWNIKPLYINGKVMRAENLVSQEKCNLALSSLDNVWQNSGILKVYAGLSFVDFIKKCAPTNRVNEIEYSQKSINALKTASGLQPKYSRMWLALASFTDVLAAREQDIAKRKEILSEAREYLDEALQLSPKRQVILTEYATNYLLTEDYKAVEKVAYDCIKIDHTQGICNWYLGVAQIFLGNQIDGKKNIEESKNKGYVDPPLLQLAVAYLSQENYKDAFEIYKHLAAFYHDNAGYHAITAALAKELGDYQTAAEETVEVFRIQPDNPESLQFLESLFQEKSSDPVVRVSLAYVYKKIGESQKNIDFLTNAKNILLGLVKDYPNKADYHFRLADIYYSLNEKQKAMDETVLANKLVEIESNKNP